MKRCVKDHHIYQNIGIIDAFEQSSRIQVRKMYNDCISSDKYISPASSGADDDDADNELFDQNG